MTPDRLPDKRSVAQQWPSHKTSRAHAATARLTAITCRALGELRRSGPQNCHLANHAEARKTTIAATAIDEAGRIDINLAPDPLLKGLLQNVGGLDPDAAEQVLDAILDWRDADDLRRPNGAEAPEYQAAGRKYVPTNAPFESTGELQRVLGMTPGLIARIADSITVYSRQRGINPATATRT